MKNDYITKNKILCLAFIVLLSASCSKRDSSSTQSSSGSGNSGFEVTPPTDSTGSDGSGTTPGTNPGTQPGDGSTGQNPSNGSDTDNQYSFVLNGGSTYTNGQELDLALTAPVSIKSIKIGQTQDCSDGSIENFKTSITKPIFNRNAVNLISVQFISFSGQVGTCLVKSILQDDQGPNLVISQYPMTNLEEGSNADLKYSVSDISGVKEVNCSLNETTKPCASGDSAVKLTNLAEGNYTFKVSAKDNFGFSSEKTVSWKVVSSYKRVNQVVEIKNDRKVDILIVVDNSQSMEYEQQSMAKRVGSLLNVLKGLDWQIAVTTTDPRNITLGDGRLVPIYGGSELFLKSSTFSDADAQYKLGMTLQRREVGSGSEQPINSTYRFIERAFGKDTAYKKFFRNGSSFAVVVISDEDESDNQFRNDPSNLINLVSTTFNQQKAFSWHSIITKPGDKICKGTYGSAYGVRLAKFSEMTGGVVGSVCEADYATQVTGIANSIVSMNKAITLTCEALPQHPIIVKRDGQPYASPFTQEGINLKFSNVLEAGVYSVEYTCLK